MGAQPSHSLSLRRGISSSDWNGDKWTTVVSVGIDGGDWFVLRRTSSFTTMDDDTHSQETINLLRT